MFDLVPEYNVKFAIFPPTPKMQKILISITDLSNLIFSPKLEAYRCSGTRDWETLLNEGCKHER